MTQERQTRARSGLGSCSLHSNVEWSGQLVVCGIKSTIYTDGNKNYKTEDVYSCITSL